MPDYSAMARELAPALSVFFHDYESTRDLGRGSVLPLTADIVGGLQTGDRFFRTDLGFACYYDGTRWLTTHEYSVTLTPFGLNPLPFAGAGPNTILLAALRTDVRAYYTRMALYMFTNTTNNAANYWVVTVGDSTAANFWVPDTHLDAVGQTTKDTANAVPGGASATYIGAQLTKVGAPGTVSALHVTGWYRLIVT